MEIIFREFRMIPLGINGFLHQVNVVYFRCKNEKNAGYNLYWTVEIHIIDTDSFTMTKISVGDFFFEYKEVTELSARAFYKEYIDKFIKTNKN